MLLEEEIVTWSASRPAWQRAVLRDLALGRVPATGEVEDFATQLVARVPSSSPPLTLADLPGSSRSGERVRVRSVQPLEHVNALVDGQVLTFASEGMTVVYGDNASGKSGYARILKKVAGARHQESVLTDIFEDRPDAAPSAVVSVEVGEEVIEQPLGDDANPALHRICYFDEGCGDDYIETESDVTYRPSALVLLDGLIGTCDAVRAELVVRAIFDAYLAGSGGLLQIRDHLNADPDRYPRPVPIDPTMARGRWSRSSIREVLRNPKYTGYQVWNRKARKTGHNRPNPPETWIWSDEPSHAAIVTREEYDAVQLRAKANARSRQGVSATDARPTAHTNYLYRGLLHCGICGLRMWGNHRRTSTYYVCQPSHQRSVNIPEGHPKSVYLNEARLNDAVLGFLGTALFGPERLEYWEHVLEVADEPDQGAPAASRAAEVECEIVDFKRRLDRQVLNLEADEITQSLRRHIAERVTELEDAITERKQRLIALAGESATEPPALSDIASLLDGLPLFADRFAELPPSELRALFEIIQLELAFHPAGEAIDVGVTLSDHWESSILRQPAEDCMVPPVGLEPTHTV